MNCDIIMQYCIYAEFPVWRQTIKRYRDKVKKIILYPSDHYRELSFEEFSRKTIPETWVKPVDIDWSTADWRQAETEPCLPYSDAEWIWFSEQDFFVDDWDEFFDVVEKNMDSADMIGLWNPTHFPYMHPACLFMKRSLLDKTKADFKAHPDINGCDHFAMLTRDAEELGAKLVSIQDLGFSDKKWERCFHLGGLSQNYMDSRINPDYVFGRAEVFYVYNYWSRKADVEQSPVYLDLSLEIEAKLEKLPECQFDPETSEWAKFFK